MSRLFKRMIRPPARLLESWRSLGEAAKQFPESIRQKYPQVPWTEMAGMRDRLIHAYFGVDYKLVWKTITERIPQVKPHLQKLLSEKI